MSKFAEEIAAKLAETGATYENSPEWTAGRFEQGEGRNKRTLYLQADRTAEEILLEAVVRAGTELKTVQRLIDRMTAVLNRYVNSPAFEKRIQARVEEVIALVIADIPIDGERLREDVRAVYLERVRTKWKERVEEEAEKTLAAALAEVKAKVVGAG